MNRLHTHIKTYPTKPGFRRRLSLTTARDAKKKNSCEETDCCGNPINVQPKPKMYVERSCHPCSFFTWKPKIPILQSAPPLADVKKKPFKKHCYAGMNFLEKSLKEIKEEAARCQKKCAVVPDCTPPPPPPPTKKPDCDQLNIPVPDWDFNKEERKDSKCPC